MQNVIAFARRPEAADDLSHFASHSEQNGRDLARLWRESRPLAAAGALELCPDFDRLFALLPALDAAPAAAVAIRTGIAAACVEGWRKELANAP